MTFNVMTFNVTNVTMGYRDACTVGNPLSGSFVALSSVEIGPTHAARKCAVCCR